MKKIIFCFFLSILFIMPSYAQMSDDQVIDYVRQEYAKGTSQQVMATNLLKMGVSQQQLERIKMRQENKQITSSSSITENNAKQLDRQRTQTVVEDEDRTQTDQVTSFFLSDEQPKQEIFGHNIFNSKNLSFSPSQNIPTPVDYILGPGDEVIIDIWGASQASVRQTISPDGNILIDRLGPIYLNGMSIKEANNYLQNKLSSIYSGISADGTSSIKLTLGQLRSIQVNVMGEVVTPGTYTVSSFSSVFNALYKAGGIRDIGSLRVINLYRNNKLIRTIDVYKYILQGKTKDDVRLMEGDMIVVPTYKALVNITGSVKRPMFYEMLPTETLETLISYAGGFKGDAYKKKIQLYRLTGNDNKIFTLTEDEAKTFKLDDQDSIFINTGLGLYENRVEIKGAVKREGFYEIGNNITTVKQLINAADGLRGDAFLNRAILTREKEDLTTEMLSIDIRNLLYGLGDDVVLRKNDILYIPSISDLEEVGPFVIHGEVARPGEYPFADNTTLEDLIIQAGGLLKSASSVKVDVSRRIIDPSALTQSRTLAENYTFSLKDGLVIDGEKGFILKPYDQVYVRKSPGYYPQKNVFVTGEVLFPGAYALNKKTERISDVIKRAGSLTLDAYPEGARLVRLQTDDEEFRTKSLMKLASQTTKDSISVESLDVAKTYNVGIELNLALKNPGSDYDIVLREGDIVVIPEYQNTVKINGAVMYPNTVVYKEGEKMDYYINQAGGYADNAKKKKSFVVYMNGTVSKIKSSDRNVIKPGSEIVVPTKEESKRMTLAEIVSMGSSVTSMASVIALLINSLSK